MAINLTGKTATSETGPEDGERGTGPSRTEPLRPRWLRYTGLALAVSITVSGLVYLLLVQSLAMAAGPALILLLGFITGTGIVLGGKAR